MRSSRCLQESWVSVWASLKGGLHADAASNNALGWKQSSALLRPCGGLKITVMSIYAGQRDLSEGINSFLSRRFSLF